MYVRKVSKNRHFTSLLRIFCYIYSIIKDGSVKAFVFNTLWFFLHKSSILNIFKSLILPTIPVIALFYFCSVTNYNLALKKSYSYFDIPFFSPMREHIRYTLSHNNCCPPKCKPSRHTKKDTTTYITISNDVLNFYYIKAHHLS